MSNEVLHLRTLSEEQVRVLVRGHLLGLTCSLYHAVNAGDAQKEPVLYAFRGPCQTNVACGAGGW